MNEVRKMTYYAIDFETANDYPNSACSLGVVRFVDGIEQDSIYSLIKPPKMYFKPMCYRLAWIIMVCRIRILILPVHCRLHVKHGKTSSDIS